MVDFCDYENQRKAEIPPEAIKDIKIWTISGERVAHSVHKGYVKLGQNSRQDILNEFFPVDSQAWKEVRRLKEQHKPSREIRTYYDQIFNDTQQENIASKAFAPVVQWMEANLGRVKSTGDVKFIQNFEEQLNIYREKLKGQEEPPESYYATFFDEDVLQFYLDRKDLDHLFPLLDANKIEYFEQQFPTGVKVLVIDYDQGWVVELPSMTYWNSRDEWIDAAADHFEVYYGDRDADKEFWDGVGNMSYVYHMTPRKNLDLIMQSGLEARQDTRGLKNTDIGSAVFAVEPGYTDDYEATWGGYGDTMIRIDLGAMKRDGYMPTIRRETPVEEKDMKDALAHAIGYEGYDFDAGEYTSDTIAILGDIPAQYLKVMEDFKASQKNMWSYKYSNDSWHYKFSDKIVKKPPL